MRDVNVFPPFVITNTLANNGIHFLSLSQQSDFKFFQP